MLRRGSDRWRACRVALLLATATGAAVMPMRAGELRAGEPTAEMAAALARLDAALAARPDDLEALAQRSRLRESAGLPMQAFLDRREILRLRPDDGDTARLAAYNLLAAGAPAAAAALVQRHPGALAGEAGAALWRQLTGDIAARHVRWGWDEPVFDPAQRRHEAETAITALEAIRRVDAGDERTAADLLLAYRLAERMADAIALWETIGRDDSPYWLRNAAADAYLAERQPAKAEELYRSLAGERAGWREPWMGIYWAAIEQRHYADAEEALRRLAKIPGQELAAEIRRGWLLLYSDRTAAAQTLFESLSERYPGDPEVRSGLVTAHLWQGWPRRGLRGVEELIARSTLDVPRVDNPPARISRAGALVSLGDLAAARREAEDLVALYPENIHARRLHRDVDTALSPEVRLEGRHDTSDRGLAESWGQLEVSVPLGTRTRLAAGGYRSRSQDDRHSAGDVRDAYLGLAVRPGRWLSLSGEVSLDAASRNRLDHDPAWRAGARLLPDDHWRLDVGYASGLWRDLPLRARAAGLVADTADLGVSYRASPRWNARAGFGRSAISDGNVRRWGLLGGQLLALQRPVYRAYLGAEVYASDSSRAGVPYYSPRRDRSAALTHRSEWVSANSPERRHTFSVLLTAGVYDQEGFDPGPVGGAWLQSDWDLTGRTVLVVGAGVRSQLYDGGRESEPRFNVTLRRRF